MKTFRKVITWYSGFWHRLWMAGYFGLMMYTDRFWPWSFPEEPAVEIWQMCNGIVLITGFLATWITIEMKRSDEEKRPPRI